MNPDRPWQGFRCAMRRGAYFAAHEILEGVWRRGRNPRVRLLIQWAALFVHWQRGHPWRALRLLDRLAAGARRSGAVPPGFDRWRAGVLALLARGTPLDPARDLRPWLDPWLAWARRQAAPTAPPPPSLPESGGRPPFPPR
ncbi:MAG: DUF309 domain-containing protein [Firmicutes bacterium]|nr:DUF309 domain-containing protein [Bacillota bacterium]